MKRKKTRSIASYRAASLRGARTRKRMQWARPLDAYKDMQIELINYLMPEEIQEIDYHGLPNPWFDMVRKMIINREVKWGVTFWRIELEKLEQVQEEINMRHGQVEFIGPEKWGDKYIAMGVQEKK